MVTNVDALRQCVDTRRMDTNPHLRAGFAGLGTMGLGMARNLASKGFPLALSNRTMEKAVRLASDLAAGPVPVVALPSPAAVAAQSDVVVSCVSDGADVEEIHLGPGGTIEGARPGTVVVDCSTIDPAVARAVAARFAEKGVAFLDAPVSGGQKGAIEGTLSFFVGGEEAALEKARPLFEAMGKRITHLGPSGAGQLGKATNQVIVAGTLAAVCEGLAFAKAAGLPLEALHAALTGGAANSWALEVLGRKMLDRDFKPAFAIKHQQKDLAIVLRTARANGVPLPATALVHQLLSALEAKGRGEEGTQALLTLYEQLSR
jgi:3-hydroxyisobutyrate dehydrogenase